MASGLMRGKHYSVASSTHVGSRTLRRHLDEPDAIAVVVMGGTALAGGKGRS